MWDVAFWIVAYFVVALRLCSASSSDLDRIAKIKEGEVPYQSDWWFLVRTKNARRNENC